MEKLEQILYKPRQILEAGKQVYKSSDLEQLSVVVLYTKNTKDTKDTKIEISPIKKGMMLEGGLEISKVGKNTITLKHDYGGVLDIYKIHPNYGLFDVEFHGIGKGKDRIRKISTSEF